VLTTAACLDLDIGYHVMENQVDSVLGERGLLEKKKILEKRKKEQPKSNTSWRSKSIPSGHLRHRRMCLACEVRQAVTQRMEQGRGWLMEAGRLTQMCRPPGGRDRWTRRGMAWGRGRRALAALAGAEVAAPLAGAVPAVAVQAGRNDGDTGEHAYVAELNGRDEKNG
jgi:hypothetical protein